MNVPSTPPQVWPVVPRRIPTHIGVPRRIPAFRDFTGMTVEELCAQRGKMVLFFLRGNWHRARIKTVRFRRKLGKVEFELMHIEGHYKLTTKYTANLKRLGRYE